MTHDHTNEPARGRRVGVLMRRKTFESESLPAFMVYPKIITFKL